MKHCLSLLPVMKRLLSMLSAFFLLSLLAIFVWLTPMSTNFLNYMLWKYSTDAPVVTGNIDYRQAHIHYEVIGSGKPVLMLHGGLSNKLCWFSQIPWLVKAGRQVVLVDTRGHGRSSRGSDVLSYEIFAEDTLKVLDRLAITRTDIVGWSDGGIIALLLGLQSPERVDRIVAISANFHPGGVIGGFDTPDPDVSYSLMNTLKSWFQVWWSGAGDRHAELEAELNTLWQTQPQLKHSDLQAIAAPTLVIAGENDIIDLPHSGEMAQMLAQGSIEIVLGAGHASPFTHPEQINQLIASFLQIPITP